MNDATQPTPEQHGHLVVHPDVPAHLIRRPPPEADDWEYHRRGPRPIASLGNMSWLRRASGERLAKQERGEDTTYIHQWTLKAVVEMVDFSYMTIVSHS